MIPIRRFSTRATRLSLNDTVCSLCKYSSYSRASIRQAQENDIVILKKFGGNGINKPILSSPLKYGASIRIDTDSIRHEEVIGKDIGNGFATSKKRIRYRIHRPTLGEYTDNSARIVTPIYSQDAELITSLLDLHVTVPGAGQETLEIFEAGTGHGALTLHLARAIHAANPAPTHIQDFPAGELGQTLREVELETSRQARRAVIHTLDISPVHSEFAQQVVKNFRGGMYYPHVDFHVGTIPAYLNSRLESNGGQVFVDNAILDLPDTHEYLEIVSKALKSEGKLITFCPSITQISNCLFYAKQHNLPLFLENVLEIGGSVGVGGREWDLRPVIPRARAKAESAASEGLEGAPSRIVPDAMREIICRPKVGLRTRGGGFVGLWRRTENYEG